MRRQEGLSLIELMVAMAIGLFLMLGVMQVFFATRQIYVNQGAVSRVQETGRMAMEFMTRDVRMAGYLGCASRTSSTVGGTALVTNVVANSTHVLRRVDFGIEGVNDTSTVPAGYGVSRVSGTDVLVVRGAFSGSAAITNNTTSSVSMDAASAHIDTQGCADNSDRVGGICANDIAVVSSCSQATVFDVNAVSNAGTVSSGATLIASAFPGGEVAAVNTVVYYVGINATTGRSGLWQKTGHTPSFPSSERPVELVEGVEDMQIKYGIDTDNDGVPDAYRDANLIAAYPSVSGWPKVMSVRIQLLVASVDDNVVAEPQPYVPVAGGAAISPGDRRLRQVFQTTVAIRSSLQ